MYTSKQASPPLKRRSSEPHHFRYKPSIVIHHDSLQAIAASSSLPRPIYGRKGLFYVVLITLICSYVQYKLFGPSLARPLAVWPSVPETMVLIEKNPPYTKAAFTLQEPSYEMLVLRSSVRHQNDTWRDAIPSKHTAERFVQSLAWLRVKEGGLRPDHKSISAFCRGVGADGVESTSIRADVDVVWTDTRDRGIGQDLMLLIECDISPFLDGSAGKSPSKYTKGPSSNSSASSRSDRMKEKVETWWNFTDDSTSIASRLPSLFLDFAFEHDMGIVETTSSGPVPLNFWFTATNIPVIFDEPQKEHVKMAACLSPAFHGPKNEGRSSHIKEQLLRWLEWREHMRRLGVERVNWYARTEEMRDFVDVYNDLQGTKDIFRWAPPLGAHQDPRADPYHDQDAYLTDCILSNRASSDYLLVLDYDEYPMVNFDNADRTPAQQWLEFMENLPDEVGGWEMIRIPMSGDGRIDRLEKGELIQDQLKCVNGEDEKVQRFYKSKTVLAVNQHKKTRMYPIGEELVTGPKMKADWKFSGKQWDSSKEGIWPKLLHYRWFADPAENGCTSPSPMKDSPGYSRYLSEVRADVFELMAQVEQELLL